MRGWFFSKKNAVWWLNNWIKWKSAEKRWSFFWPLLPTRAPKGALFLRKSTDLRFSAEGQNRTFFGLPRGGVGKNRTSFDLVFFLEISCTKKPKNVVLFIFEIFPKPTLGRILKIISKIKISTKRHLLAKCCAFCCAIFLRILCAHISCFAANIERLYYCCAIILACYYCCANWLRQYCCCNNNCMHKWLRHLLLQ